MTDRMGQPTKPCRPISLTVGGIIQFTYRNYRGEVSERQAKPLSIWFGTTEWHPELQWLMSAVDMQKGERRDFAMRDMTNVRDKPNE